MWEIPPSNLILKPGEVHIWQAFLPGAADAEKTFLSILSQDELDRAARFRFSADRAYFIASRGILRYLTGKYTAQEASAIAFLYGDKGKPELPKGHAVKFNVSHSGERALFGFCLNMDLGIDLELINPDIEIATIAKHFFSKVEIEALFRLPVDQQVAGFFNCWTRKEAFIKAKGDGLSFPLDQFAVSLEPGKEARLLEITCGPEKAADWSLISLVPAKEYVGALAVNGQVDAVKYWDLGESPAINNLARH